MVGVPAPAVMVRAWLRDDAGVRPVVLLNLAHPVLQRLQTARGGHLADTREMALRAATELEDLGMPEAVARAEFIRRQCAGDQAEALFDAHRDSWGIPAYREDLVLASDFREGFLWRFRDHDTSRSDNLQAKEWFLSTPEARFVQRYEFWSSSEGAVANMVGEGSYRQLVEREVAWGLPASLSVLDVPVFTLDDYQRFGRDPAFAKAQEELRWCLRDGYEWQRNDYREHAPHLLTLLPGDAEARCELARLSLYQGDPDQARALLDQALEVDATQWRAWYYLGITCALAGDPGRAARCFREAVVRLLTNDRDPTKPWYRIGLVTDQLAIYGQAIQRLGAETFQGIVAPPHPPDAP